MQVANFRDEVVYAIAYKMGLDPTIDLQVDQAAAYVTYINTWLRRLYPNFDWPEWTLIKERTPNASHYVSYTQVDKKVIGRVLKVYLADPSSVHGTFDVPFKLDANGIFVGFEHGQTVWIKFIEAAPQFTFKVWATNVIYNEGTLVYSPVSGECYKSKINGNRGHDPSIGGTHAPDPVPTEITQEATLDQPGLPATAKQIEIDFNQVLGGEQTVPDPPPVGAVFSVSVDAGPTTVSHTATGAESLTAIVADIKTQLLAAPALSTFTITTDTSGFALILTNASDFMVNASYGATVVVLPLVVKQLQAYVPSTPPGAGLSQIVKVTLSDDLVARGTQFILTFIDALGVEHTVTYTASVNDASEQVLAGLAAAIVTLGATDPVVALVQSSIDLPNKTISLITPKEIGVSAAMLPEASLYWEQVLFPLELVDLVVRGAYADALREDGQLDKAQAEEQSVSAEVKLKLGGTLPGPYNTMTDQAVPAPGYHVPGLVGAGGG